MGLQPLYLGEKPYHGAYLAVIESVSKLIATGAEFSDVYLTFQEYFERLGKDEKRWGKPLAALLGAFKAQTDLGIAAIGGKDSMSGTFEKLDVPPTLVSFAVTTDKVKNVTANEFKKAGDKVVLIAPEYNKNDLPDTASLLAVYGKVTSLLRSGKALACYTPTYGGIAEAVMKMCFGNSLGFKFSDGISLDTIFGYCYGGFLLEVTEDIEGAVKIGEITSDGKISYRGEEISSASCSALMKISSRAFSAATSAQHSPTPRISHILLKTVQHPLSGEQSRECLSPYSPAQTANTTAPRQCVTPAQSLRYSLSTTAAPTRSPRALNASPRA